MHRLLVTGARDLPEAEIVWIPLWLALHQHQSIIIGHGQNPKGTDLYVHEWFELPEQPFNRGTRCYEPKVEYLAIEDPEPAQWGDYGKAAGNIRNQVMVDKPVDEVYAFPTPASKGTWDCVARAWVRGIPVWIYDHLQILQRRLLDPDEGEYLARRRLGWGR